MHVSRSVSVIVSAIGCGALPVLAACGSDSISIDQVSAEGSVGGLIVDAATRAPLAGVSVRLVAGGRVFDPETTADDGTFGFDGVPAGGVIVAIDAPGGHAGAWIVGELPASAGEYPAGNSTLTLGPIGLVPTSGSFAVRVLDGAGEPVVGYELGAHVSVQYVDFSGGAPDAIGELVTTATTDGDGYASITGLPSFAALGPSVPDALVLVLPPRDANADGIFEFGGGDRVFNLRDLDDPTPDVILTAGYDATLRVRASTISQLVSGGGTPAVIPTNGTVFVTFNLPIQATAKITVVDEDGTATVSPTVAIRDDSLTLAFASAGLTAGAEYNLSIHAVAAVGDRLVVGDFVGSFFTPGAGGVSVTGATRDGGQNVFVTFSEPIGGLGTSLAGGNCVLFFQVDIDGAGGIGNTTNELGNGACDVGLGSNEPDPAGPVGPSGYTRRWIFNAPLISGGNPIPQNTPVHVVFGRVQSTAAVMQRATGAPANDLMFLMPP